MVTRRDCTICAGPIECRRMVNVLCIGLLIVALIAVMMYVIITDEERLK